MSFFASFRIEEQHDEPKEPDSHKTCDQRKIYLPLLGAFSSGKSSLLNSVFGEKILSTDITPETAVPAEIRGGSKLLFKQVLPDGQVSDISKELFQAADFSELAAQGGHLELTVPGFARWPNLIAVDLPGWSSGESDHEKQLDNYLSQMLTGKLDTDIVYAVVVGADEGTLRSYTADRLKGIELGNSDYLIVITKTERRTEDDLQSVSEHLEESIKALMGKAPLAVLLTSASKKKHDGFIKLLDQIQESTIDKKQALEEVRSEIIEQLKSLKQALESDMDDDPDDIGEFTAKDFGYDYSDILDASFKDQLYSSLSLKWFLQELSYKYNKYYEENFNKWVTTPSAELQSSLVNLGLHSDALMHVDSNSEAYARAIKESLKKRFESAKPGMFTGKHDPEAQGQRMISKMENEESTVKNAAKRFGRQAAKDNIRSRMDAVDRLLSII